MTQKLCEGWPKARQGSLRLLPITRQTLSIHTFHFVRYLVTRLPLLKLRYCLTLRIAAQSLDVVAAFEGRRVWYSAATEAATHLLDGLVLVFFHPAHQVGLDGR